ncbi:DUF6391 domain-containing protein [Chroococcidiopsis thermalis]|jgi:hypothetical protein|uniref:Uncharacterized protein n=1 Tax=Chroococcidiopsis thermalis (strain PCC 7203) TaxID=251229 RepID=K9U040_CHRTP|nr:DUF6391 domain-containing protein [Chroococcidiopsis thermalis]AFY87614.1 hypothetical protein Chro_2107 [Chroococcidiopsis thermalis PCC 7203]
MNNFAPDNVFESLIPWFNFGENIPQPTQDADLVKHLPFVPGLKELLMLRQVHALEHATVWLLSQSGRSPYPRFSSQQTDNESLGGLSTERGFYIYGQVNKIELQRAVLAALQRLTNGEWNLALHPRCGTNVSVGLLLGLGLVMGMHLLLPRSPIEQMLGLGVAATAAANLTPELGMLAQRHVTTAIPFNLEIVNIADVRDETGRTAHFVQVRWRELVISD